MILFQLIEGKFPYTARDMDSLYKAIRENPVPQLSAQVSPELQDLVERLLEKDIKKRIGWEDFFIHPWIYPPFLRYLDEICLLANLKASSYESLGQALLLYSPI